MAFFTSSGFCPGTFSQWGTPAPVTAEELKAHIKKALEDKNKPLAAEAPAADTPPTEAVSAEGDKPKISPGKIDENDKDNKEKSETQDEAIQRLSKRAQAHTYDHPAEAVLVYDPQFETTTGKVFSVALYFQLGEHKCTLDATGYFKGSGSKRVFIIKDVGIVVTTAGKHAYMPELIGDKINSMRKN